MLPLATAMRGLGPAEASQEEPPQIQKEKPLAPHASESQGSPASLGSAILRVKIVVSGLRWTKANNGMLRAALFTSAEGFPDEAPRAAAHGSLDLDEWLAKQPAGTPAQDGTSREVVMTLETSSQGAQRPTGGAVTLFHDANRNGRLDKGLFGIPSEGFGFSANPRIWTGAPSFSDCLVSLSGEAPAVAIKMVYLKP